MCPIQISTHEDQKIPEEFREDLRALLKSAFDHDEDAIVFEPEVHTKILAIDSDEKVVGHLAAYVREVDFVSDSKSLGMIGGVAVSPRVQKQGIAKRMIKKAHELFLGVGVKYSILFACEPAVYKSSGYRMMANEVHFLDEDRKWKTFVYRGSMYCELSNQMWPDGLVNLRGRAV